MDKKNIYFASDIHLGLPTPAGAVSREALFVQWLDRVKADAAEIYLVGDIFDFWFEYKRVVPKGFTRFLGKIAEITDSGTPVHFFTGNHDVWMFDYLEKEVGVQIHRKPIIRELNGVRFYIAHGDGLIQGDYGYKLLKSLFTSKTLQWLFARLHPNFAMWLGQGWSVSSRNAKNITYDFKGNDEPIVHFANNLLLNEQFDYFVLGHWHVPVIHPLNSGKNLVMLGDWIVSNSYARWDGKQMTLLRFSPQGDDEILAVK